jgi:autotransporter strand-loop-strand O-heptosyltransferase
MKVKAHTCLIGETGYANHARNFFTALNKLTPVKVRNYTVGGSWEGLDGLHDKEWYLTDEHKEMLVEQILFESDGSRNDVPIYAHDKSYVPDVNITLETVGHHIFHDDHDGYSIGYNVWETTEYPPDFFDLIQKYDEFWVPTQWQKDCLIKQGYKKDVKVIPEGVNGDVFKPAAAKKSGKFRFVICGRWDYRKSTEDMIRRFLNVFKGKQDIEFILNVDNTHAKDGLTTEERLLKLGLNDPMIKVVRFLSHKEYINLLQNANVFVSCARSEGWNLPLIEAMACGIPSIYSNWGGQLEFAKGMGLPVKVAGERPASNLDNGTFGEFPGNYCEPDWNDFELQLKSAYANNLSLDKKALRDSIDIRTRFTWKNAATTAHKELLKAKNKPLKIIHNMLDGPTVELKGDSKEHEVKFMSPTQDVWYETKIRSNHWAKLTGKYFQDFILSVDGGIVDTSLKGRLVRIEFDSRALGDTIAWMPAVEAFRKKHQCKVTCATYFNHLFKGCYPDISMVEPGVQLEGTYAKFLVGYFFEDRTLSRVNPKTQNLQEVAFDILGLDFKEQRPDLIDVEPFAHPRPYVCISTQSTAQCKYWNNPEGWDRTVEFLNGRGLDTICIDRHPKFGGNGHMNSIPNGVVDMTGDLPLEKRISQIKGAEIFIGLSSGLSWLAWALNKPTILISGFTEPYNDPTTPYRIINENVCHGCWNDTDLKFNKDDWTWCPRKKDFECTKQISAKMVIEQIKRIKISL